MARRYKIAPSLIFGCRKAMEAGAATGLQAEEPLVPASEVKQLKAQIRELERGDQESAIFLLPESPGQGRFWMPFSV